MIVEPSISEAIERGQYERRTLEAITLALIHAQRAGFTSAVSDLLLEAKAAALREVQVCMLESAGTGPRGSD